MADFRKNIDVRNILIFKTYAFLCIDALRGCNLPMYTYLVCMFRSVEFEKLKRENASQKDLERAEAKFKTANENYRSLLEKYENIRNDFSRKMTESCQRFQDAEETHLGQMRDFMDTYGKAWESQHVLLG